MNKWYWQGETGRQLRIVLEAFMDGFSTKDEFSYELDMLGLTYEEQNEVLRDEIAKLEMQLLDRPTNGTIH